MKHAAFGLAILLLGCGDGRSATPTPPDVSAVRLSDEETLALRYAQYLRGTVTSNRAELRQAMCPRFSDSDIDDHIERVSTVDPDQRFGDGTTEIMEISADAATFRRPVTSAGRAGSITVHVVRNDDGACIDRIEASDADIAGLLAFGS